MTIDVSNGKKFSDEPAAAAVGSDKDVLLIRFADGTGVKQIPVSALKAYFGGSDITALKAIIGNYNNAGFHNSIYRGKNLGSSVSDTQAAAIKNGTFSDIFVGDYWLINGINYRVAACDYYYNFGDGSNSCTAHHVFVVPDQSLGTGVMNTSDTSNGAYAGSVMHKTNLSTIRTNISTAFGSTHILTHRMQITSAVSNGAASAWTWESVTAELLNEVQVYGTRVWGGGYNVGSQNGQLPLFALNHRLIATRYNWWLQDVSSATAFSIVIESGSASNTSASFTHNIRPGFCVI